jgi:hypothetical protein
MNQWELSYNPENARLGLVNSDGIEIAHNSAWLQREFFGHFQNGDQITWVIPGE